MELIKSKKKKWKKYDDNRTNCTQTHSHLNTNSIICTMYYMHLHSAFLNFNSTNAEKWSELLYKIWLFLSLRFVVLSFSLCLSQIIWLKNCPISFFSYDHINTISTKKIILLVICFLYDFFWYVYECKMTHIQSKNVRASKSKKLFSFPYI